MKKYKLISNVAALTALSSLPLSLIGCSQNTTTEVHISILSDIHGEIPGYGDDFFKQSSKCLGAIRASQEIQKMQSPYPGSITLLCGDQNGSGTFSTCASGDTMYPVLSAMNAPYSAVGNHAWDFGKDKLESGHFDQLGRNTNTKGSYFVTGNVLNDRTYQTKKWIYKENEEGFIQDYYIWKNAKVAWADSYKIIDMNGHKVALIGLTTQSALQDSNKEETKNLSFIDYIPAVHYIKYEMLQDLGQSEFDKIDAFVGLTHVEVGKNDDGSLKGGAVELCKNIDTRLDLCLSGHWHSDVADKVHNDNLNKDIPILQTKAHLESIGDAQIIFDDTKKEGQRLKDIEVKIITPTIESEYDKAAQQIQDIVNNPFNDVVKNTCKVYQEQKDIAIAKLNEELGTSLNGLKYDTFEKWDQRYGSTGVEQTGVFVSKSSPLGLSIVCKDKIEKGELVNPNFGITAWDSIRQSLEPGAVRLRDVYGIYAFDNKPVYFSLTYYQLEQVIQYMLSGQINANKGPYTVPLYYKEGQQVPTEVLGTLYETPCPGQFAGLAFKVDKHENPDGTHYYTYVDDSLKIYNPDSDKDIDDIDSYEPKSFWTDKPIVGVTADFTFNDGNNEYKMLKRFAQWNDEQESSLEKYKIHTMDFDMRILVTKTMQDITAKGQTIDISTDILNKMFEGF